MNYLSWRPASRLTTPSNYIGATRLRLGARLRCAMLGGDDDPDKPESVPLLANGGTQPRPRSRQIGCRLASLLALLACACIPLCRPAGGMASSGPPAQYRTAWRANAVAAAETALLPTLRHTTGPILLTILTAATEDWQLGVSAALHGLPLVVVGLGQLSWKASQATGAGTAAAYLTPKIAAFPLIQRALRVLHLVAPKAHVLVLDGLDTVVANAPSPLALAPDTVLVSGECNSWPKCYYGRYLARDASHAQCVRSGTCYANSGAYAGRPATLLRFVGALQEELAAIDHNLSSSPAERGNDQAALHRLYAGARNDAGQPPLHIRVDSRSELSLNLYECNGPLYHRYFPDIEECHAVNYDPLKAMAAVRGGIGVGDSRPLIVHANGNHARMMWSPKLTPVLRPLVRRTGALLAHPVLLVDETGASASTLARVLGTAAEGAANATAAEAGAAASWLAAASEGFCRPTNDGDAGDCLHGEQGNWKLQAAEKRTWAAAVSTCLRHCRSCGRCQVRLAAFSQGCNPTQASLQPHTTQLAAHPFGR